MALGGGAVRSVAVRLAANVGDYVQGIGRAKQVTTDFRRELAESARKGEADLNKVANGAIIMGTALVAAVAGVVMQGARFEHSMAQVQAVSGATADEFAAMRQAAIDMGSSTVFSASEAANATEELAKAGLSAAEITGGALAGALNLAAAGGIGLAESASIAAGTMRAFGLAASDVNRIADVLASGANRANTGVSELGQGLSNAGVVAAQAGLSIEEATAALALFADNNVKGADAGTQLKTTLLRLLAPTDQAKAKLDALGISVYDTQGNAKDLVGIVGALEDGLSGMTQQQQAATLSMLFGQRAIIGSNILLKEGAEGVGEYVDMVSEMGVAADTAAARLDSLQGDAKLLQSALEGLAIESSGSATGGLRILTQLLTQMVTQVNALPAPIVQAGVVLAGLIGVSLLVGGSLLKLQLRLAALNAQMAATGPAGAKAAGGLAAVARWGGIAAAVFIGLQVISAVAEQFRPAAADADKLAEALRDLANTGKVTGEAARVLGDDLSKIRGDLKQTAADDWLTNMLRTWEGAAPIIMDIGRSLDNITAGKTTPAFREAAENVSAFEAALISLVQQGELEHVSQLLAEMVATDPTMNWGDIEDAMPGVVAAMREARSEMNEVQQRTGEVGNDLDILAERFELTGDTAVEAVAEMLDAWSKSATDFVSLSGAYKDALSEVGDAAEVTADGFIESLRKQVEAQEKWAENMEKLAKRVPEVMLDELMRLGPEGAEMVALMADMQEDELNEVIDLWQRSGAATGDAIAEGILQGTEESGRAVDRLAGKVKDLPAEKTTKVKVDPGPSLRIVDSLKRALNSLENKTVTVTTYTQTQPVGGQAVRNRWGGVYANVDGGLYRAQSGLLRRAQIFPPLAPARFAFAEPETGGEAFIPRRGDRSRSLAIADLAARWHGGRVVAGGDGAAIGGQFQWHGQRGATDGSPAVGGSLPPEVRVFIGDRELTDIVRVEVSDGISRHDRGLRRRMEAGTGAAR